MSEPKKLSKITQSQKNLSHYFFLILTGILLLAIASLSIHYSSQSLDGHWTSPQLEKRLSQEMNHNIKEWINSQTDNPNYLKEVQIDLDAKDNLANATIHVQFDRQKMMDEYQNNLGFSVSDKEYQTLLNRTDQLLANSISELNGDYDANKGKATIAVFQAKVDPLFKNLTVTTSNPKTDSLLLYQIDTHSRLNYRRDLNDLNITIDNKIKNILFKKE